MTEVLGQLLEGEGAMTKPLGNYLTQLGDDGSF
jgi:hypothetical protein